MNRIIQAAFSVLTVIFMLWIIISWVDVVSHNAPGETGTHADWNAFVILMREAE